MTDKRLPRPIRRKFEAERLIEGTTLVCDRCPDPADWTLHTPGELHKVCHVHALQVTKERSNIS